MPLACVTYPKTERPTLHYMSYTILQCLTLTKRCGDCKVAVCLLVTGVHGLACSALQLTDKWWGWLGGYLMGVYGRLHGNDAIGSSPSSSDNGTASRTLNLLALLVWESVHKLCLPSTVPGIWLDPPGKAWAAPVAVSCLSARLAAVDVLQVDGPVCVEASARLQVDGSVCVEASARLKLAMLAVIPASRAKVAPTGPCKSLIIFSMALTLFMACSNFAKQGCLQRKSGFPSLGNTKEGFTNRRKESRRAWKPGYRPLLLYGSNSSPQTRQRSILQLLVQLHKGWTWGPSR